MSEQDFHVAASSISVADAVPATRPLALSSRVLPIPLPPSS
jgi:hypothetical protein